MSGRLRPQTGRTTLREDDAVSIASFRSSPSPTKSTIRLQTWTGNQQIDHDTYHKMLEEYRAAKQKQQGDELKIRQLAAQLARTEEAAKRALIRADQGVKGSTAQQLLDAQRQIQQLQAENSELSSKLAKERKRASEFRASAEDYRRRMEAALKEQRQLVRKLGDAERSLGGSTAARAAARKAAAEQEYWSEEAGRRFAAQQDELVALREANEQLQQQLAAAVPAETATRYESTIKELQQMVHFYERRLAQANISSGGACGLQDAVSGDASGAGSSGCGRWLLEALVEGGACYLWEPSSGRVFSDPPEGQWPRPVGMKHPDASGGLHLGVRGRLDAVFRALADLMQTGNISARGGYSQHSSTSTDGQGGPVSNLNLSSNSGLSRVLADALRQLLTKVQPGRAPNSCSSLAHAAAGGAGMVDVRDVPALLTVLLPGLAHKEVVELAAWLRAGAQQQQAQQHGPGLQRMSLQELEAAIRSLVEARDAVRQGRDLAVNEALLRVRRLLRSELQAVVSLSESLEGQDGSLSGLQAVQLLQQEHLLPDLSAAEAHHLLMLLHEWDLAGTGRHSLTDVYICLQLLTLVRVPAGALSGQGAAAASGLALPERPDSRQSNATISSLTTSTSVAGRVSAGAAHLPGAGSGGGLPQQKRQQNKRGAIGAAWEGLQGPGGNNGGIKAGLSLKEAYLKERVAALEAELTQARSGSGAVHSKEVDQLRAEVARYQARLAELENDFLSLDVVANTEATEYDAELRKAWFTAAAFKKRYVEHKLELDTIKKTAEKMQAALDDTHRALHAEAARRMALEEAVTVAKLEAARSKELAATVAAERAERLKLEKDYLELQSKAFAAPGSALAEVRQLREELLAARRDRAVGEAREAELRRELSTLKRQLEGVSPEEHRRLARELAERQRQCTTMELELRAALDKLEVYRWADDAAATAPASATAAPAGALTVAGMSQQPDDEKSVEELRSELEQLRQAMALQGEEAQKLRKLLDTEASISLEAKAALEEAQGALATAKAEAAQQLAKLRRDLDNREEKVRKLEQQLRNAYGSMGRAALRASGNTAPDGVGGSVRVSRIGLAAAQAPMGQSLDETLEALAPHENLIEILVSEATLTPAADLAPDASTFIAWDFFLHDSQATPVLPGRTPSYNTTVRYIVEADGFLLEYLSKQQLALEVFEARGWDVRALGVAHMPLQTLLKDLEVGAALGNKRAWHHVDIVGSNGQQLGRVRVGFRVAKPIDNLLLQQHQQQEAAIAEAQAGQQDQDAAAADTGADAAMLALQQAAEQADAEPSKASHLLVTIHRCEGLSQQQQQGAPAQRPYVHYTPPGRGVAHDTSIGTGAAPVFEDAASWGLTKSAALMSALQQYSLQVAVFDDAEPEPTAALLGLASVPLGPLGEGVPVQGGFTLSHPVTGAPAGTVWVSVAWHDPLAAAALGNRLLTARVPMLDSTAAAAAAAAGAAGASCGVGAGGGAAGGSTVQGATGSGDPAVEAMQAQLQQLQLQLQLHQQQQTQQQQQQQQQSGWAQVMQAPQMLASVPMLLSNPQQQQALQPHMPGVSPAAAAAVAAAFGQQQQQQQVPLLWNAAPPGDPTSPFKAQGQGYSGSVMMLQHRSPTAAAAMMGAGGSGGGGIGYNLRYGAATNPLQQSVEQQQVQTYVQAAAGQGRQGSPALQQPVVIYSQQQQQQQGSEGASAVLRRVNTNAEAWVNCDTTIYFRVEGLSLSDDALGDPAVRGRHVLLAHMLLEDFTSPVQQCTETALAEGPSYLSYSYAVAYSIADPVTKAPTAAGRALAAALAAADAGEAPRLVLPVLLACSNTALVTDFSQVDCVASCELQLSDLWQGLSGDIISREFSLVPAVERAEVYPSGSVGQLRLTLVAARALKTLMEHTQQ